MIEKGYNPEGLIEQASKEATVDTEEIKIIGECAHKIVNATIVEMYKQ